jgi:hypothetical protein
LRPAVAAHDIWIASGLECLLPETALLCVQRSDAIDVLRARGVDVFCLAEHADPASLAGASSADLFAHPAARDFVKRAGSRRSADGGSRRSADGGSRREADGASLGVIAFKPNARLQAAVSAAGATLLAGDSPAARALENKLAFVEVARRAGLRTPRWEVVEPTAPRGWEALAARFGPRFVVQGARGNAGQRTWLVEDEPSLRRAIAAEGERQLRVGGFVEGMPFTATGVAAPASGEGSPGGAARVASRAAGAPPGPLVDWIEPCRQVTGIDWLTPMPLGSCGNAWGAAALRPTLDHAREVLDRLAAELSAAGYRGLFGVDFVLGPDGPVVIETNPRLVASIPLATQLEAVAGRPTLLLRHLALAAGDVGPPALDRPALPEASQVIIHRRDGDPPRGSNLASGVYRLAPGEAPVRLRDGAWLSDLAAPGEALLLARQLDQPVSPRRELARVYLRSSLAERHPGLRELVDAVRGRS